MKILHWLAHGRSFLYKTGFRPVISLPAFTVSVGNLAMGGTGKSPLTALLARHAVELGLKPLVLSRGYGRAESLPILVQAGEQTPSAQMIGDEPAMIHHKVPSSTLVVHKDRAYIAREEWQNFSCNIIFLDDGFQHWQAARDLDIVLIDAQNPNKKLREPWEALRRAEIVVVTNAKNISLEVLSTLKENIEKVFKKTKNSYPWKRKNKQRDPVLFFADYSDETIMENQHKVNAKSFLSGKSVVLLSGIAKPKYLEDRVKFLGAQITKHFSYKDHYNLKLTDIEKINKVLQKNPEAICLTTEKDFYRWQEHLTYFIKQPSVFCVEFYCFDPWQEGKDLTIELKRQIFDGFLHGLAH